MWFTSGIVRDWGGMAGRYYKIGAVCALISCNDRRWGGGITVRGVVLT